MLFSIIKLVTALVVAAVAVSAYSVTKVEYNTDLSKVIGDGAWYDQVVYKLKDDVKNNCNAARTVQRCSGSVCAVFKTISGTQFTPCNYYNHFDIMRRKLLAMVVCYDGIVFWYPSWVNVYTDGNLMLYYWTTGNIEQAACKSRSAAVIPELSGQTFAEYKLKNAKTS